MLLIKAWKGATTLCVYAQLPIFSYPIFDGLLSLLFLYSLFIYGHYKMRLREFFLFFFLYKIPSSSFILLGEVKAAFRIRLLTIWTGVGGLGDRRNASLLFGHMAFLVAYVVLSEIEASMIIPTKASTGWGDIGWKMMASRPLEALPT